MRRGKSATFVAVLTVGLMTGCGGDDDDNPFVDAAPRIDAVDVDAYVPPDAPPPDAVAPDAPMDDEGPIVHVTSPTVPSDFTSDQIVTAARFTATCTAAINPGTNSPVDPESVTISALGEGIQFEAYASPTTEDDQYVANLVVADFPNGPLTIRCSASDSASPARRNSAEIQTYLDLGPHILVLNPLDDAYYANQINVSFKVLEYPVDPSDTMAAPDYSSVTASVAGVDLEIGTDIAQDPPDSGTFKGTVTFDDPRFIPTLEGANTLSITAANTRTATAVTRQRDLVFVADSQGPTIAFNSPSPGEFISGIFTLSAEVTDPAGVDPSSVIATIAGTHEFPLLNTGGDNFEGTFDTRKLPSTMVFPTIVLRAQDAVGNQGAAGMLVTLDNQPPILSLDPPNMREYRYSEEIDAYECSWLFDPLGGAFDPLGIDPDFGDAIDDGESVAQLSEIRARVEDRGNQAMASSGVFVPQAGVDPASVELFVLDDEEGALLVDTDGDGYCDEINPLLEPTSVPVANDEAAVIGLASVSPTGSAYYANPPTDNPETPETEVYPAQPWFSTTGPEGPEEQGGINCWPGEATEAPGEDMCITVIGNHVIDAEVGTAPVIYGIPPFGEYSCLGNAFDSSATNISDGWACLALRATDGLGNVGISAPLRVCFDHDGDQVECPAWGTVTSSGLPDCTGVYDSVTNTTNASVGCALREVDGGANLIRSWLYEDYPWLQLRNSES